MNKTAITYLLIGALGTSGAGWGSSLAPSWGQSIAPEARQHMARESALALTARGNPIDYRIENENYRIGRVRGSDPSKIPFGEVIKVQIGSIDSNGNAATYGNPVLCSIGPDGKLTLYSGTENQCDAALQGFYTALQEGKARAEGAVGIRINGDELTHAAHGTLPKKDKDRVSKNMDMILRFTPGFVR